MMITTMKNKMIVMSVIRQMVRMIINKNDGDNDDKK